MFKKRVFDPLETRETFNTKSTYPYPSDQKEKKKKSMYSFDFKANNVMF